MPRRRTTYRSSPSLPSLIFLLTLGLMVASMGTCAYAHLQSETLTVTVTDKQRIVDRGTETVTARYIVDTTRPSPSGEPVIEVFENTDTLLRGKWNSSDVQAQLLRGGTYEINVYGFRLPFFSSYRNIIEVVRTVEPPPTQ